MIFKNNYIVFNNTMKTFSYSIYFTFYFLVIKIKIMIARGKNSRLLDSEKGEFAVAYKNLSTGETILINENEEFLMQQVL